MSDELPTAARVSDPGIRALYRLENRWQAWLDVEAALAEAQAELGIIPRPAGEAIARSARLELLDRARIDEGFARTGHTIVPLVWELARIVGEPHGGWVHWGATTQNITQTGDLLVLRQAHCRFLRLIAAALVAMADLAERGAEMPIAGRTHGQHAVPATFGHKPAVWIDEMIRHVERLRQIAPRLFVAMLGGGAGTFASIGAQGPAVQAGISKQLGMLPMKVPARTIGDHLAENICVLGLLAGTGGKIGREIYTLMKTEYGEVEEPVPPGTVGSSTMPQKRNPKLCQDIIAAAAEVRAAVPLALEAMQTEHEADRTTSLIMEAAEARACIATGDMLARLAEVLKGLRLDPVRMRKNLDLGGGLIMAEAVMLNLGAAIGRQHAHDVVYDAAQAAFVEGRPFGAVLAEDSRVTEHLGRRRSRACLTPPPILACAPRWPAMRPSGLAPPPARLPAKARRFKEDCHGYRRWYLLYRILDLAYGARPGTRRARLRLALGGRALAHPGHPPVYPPAGRGGADQGVL
jgi:adenylosuccinate lyase